MLMWNKYGKRRRFPYTTSVISNMVAECRHSLERVEAFVSSYSLYYTLWELDGKIKLKPLKFQKFPITTFSRSAEAHLPTMNQELGMARSGIGIVRPDLGMDRTAMDHKQALMMIVQDDRESVLWSNGDYKKT